MNIVYLRRWSSQVKSVNLKNKIKESMSNADYTIIYCKLPFKYSFCAFVCEVTFTTDFTAEDTKVHFCGIVGNGFMHFCCLALTSSSELSSNIIFLFTIRLFFLLSSTSSAPLLRSEYSSAVFKLTRALSNVAKTIITSDYF